VVGTLVVVLAGLTVLVSQLSGAGAGTPLNAVAAAAVKTQEERGGRAIMRIVPSSASGKSLTITGRAVFDTENRARAVLVVPATGSNAAFSMEEITDGAVLYMRSPKLSLPHGLEWMKIDLEAAVGLKVPTSTGSDPRGELTLLQAAGNVRKLGKEDVRGVSTMRYRGTIGVDESVDLLRERGEGELADRVEKNGYPLHFEVWIGSDGLVRRLRMFDLHSYSEGADTSVDMTMDFFDFGFEPQIEAPDPSKVFDATSLAASS
jgi:hypothetical protein